MAAPYSLILRKTERAFLALLTAAQIPTPGDSGTPFTDIFSGKSALTKTAPCIIVHAESAVSEPVASGNSRVSVSVMVKFPLGTDQGEDEATLLALSDAFTAAVFDALLPGLAGDFTALADALNTQSITDFTAMQSYKTGEDSGEDDGEVWVETLKLDIYAAPVSGL